MRLDKTRAGVANGRAGQWLVCRSDWEGGMRRQGRGCSRAQRGWATRDRGATGAGTMGVRRNKRSRGTRAGAITTDARGSAQAASRLQGDVQRDARTMGARASAYKMAYGVVGVESESGW